MGGGVKVGVPPGRLPVEAGPKGLGWAWEGRLRVLAWHKIDPSWSAFAIFTHPTPPPPTHPLHPPTDQIDPKPAKPCPQLMQGVDQ